MFNKVIVGGTFGVVHKGHRRLLEVAFDNADAVVIGLTSDEFANRFRVMSIPGFDERKRALEAHLNVFGKEFEIIEINDSYGIATLDPDSDCIVVSEETLLRAEEINAIRFKKGLERLIIVVVPMAVAENGAAISSDSVQNGVMDAEGRILKK